MTSRIEMGYQKENSVDGVGEDVPTNLCIMNLVGCLELDDVVVEEKDGLNTCPEKVCWISSLWCIKMMFQN